MIGLIHSKDFLGKDLDDQLTRLEELKRDILYIPESNMAYQVLERFRERRQYVGIIVDEYGGVLGMVTLNDIVDALVGDISDTNEFEFEIVERSDGSYLVDAQIPFDDFLDNFNINIQNRREMTGFDTLGGFALQIIKDIPKTGETFIWQEYQFEIIDMDKSRIDKILVTKRIEE